MDDTVKRQLKRTILALRNRLEKDDLPLVLKQHGLFGDRDWIPLERLPLLDDVGKERRRRLEEAMEREIVRFEGDRKGATEAYTREVAFTYLNRLVGLKCMESRGLMDECITTRTDYAGRSLRHYRFRAEHPDAHYDAEDTDGLKAFLRFIFAELAGEVSILFDPEDEFSIVMPSYQALKDCIRALNEEIPAEAFAAPDLLGGVYQYFNVEEKNRVDEGVHEGKKIEGDDIIPATCIYTEPYMVEFLVQNSLGAIWMEMYPESKLCEGWAYLGIFQQRYINSHRFFSNLLSNQIVDLLSLLPKSGCA